VLSTRVIVELAFVGLLTTGCAATTTAGQPEAARGTVQAAAAAAAASATPTPPAAAASTSASVTPTPKPKPEPKPNPCAGNVHRQLVLVSIATQHLWMCTGTALAYSTAVTTGAVDLPYDSTPTGTFEIQGRVTHTTLTLNTGKTYAVNYWIPFQGPLFGFHDSSWQTFPYGSQLYRTQGSHGCVHMPLPAIAFLYRWADTGATVTIRA
jgi:hypothetical protein